MCAQWGWGSSEELLIMCKWSWCARAHENKGPSLSLCALPIRERMGSVCIMFYGLCMALDSSLLSFHESGVCSACFLFSCLVSLSFFLLCFVHILIGRLIKIIISSLAARYSETADGAVWQLPVFWLCRRAIIYLLSSVRKKGLKLPKNKNCIIISHITRILRIEISQRTH